VASEPKVSLLFGHYGGAFASVGEIVVDGLEELLHLDWSVLLAVHFHFFIVNLLLSGFVNRQASWTRSEFVAFTNPV